MLKMKKINKPAIVMLAFLLLLSLSFSQQLEEQNENAKKSCPQCYQSTVRLEIIFHSPLTVKAHATYLEPEFYTIDEIENEQIKLTARPASGARISFYVDGLPITDEFGKEVKGCTNTLADEKGVTGIDGDCVIEYVKNPYYDSSNPTKNPIAIKITDWPQNAMLTARLISSDEIPDIKPSTSPSAIIATGNSPSQLLFTAFLHAAQNPKNMPICLYLFIALGLLVASMQYAGKNPLSLFDITVPRMPNVKKVRMKPATIPLHLQLKGRMANRIVGRNEKIIISQILSLYRRTGRSYAGLRKEISSLFPRGKVHLTPSRFASDKDYEKIAGKLNALIDASGANKHLRDRAQAVARRQLEIREAVLTDVETYRRARGGVQKGTFAKKMLTPKITPWLEYLGTRIAKPWKFIPGIAKKEWADALPGLPYVEQVSLVVQNWLGSRLSHLSVRRSLYKTAAAETARSLGILRKDHPFVRRHILDNKKLGDLPHIVERMRQETYILGRAVADEYLRKLVLAAVLKRKEAKDGKLNFDIDSKHMQKVLSLLEKIKREAEDQIKSGKLDKEYKHYFINEEFAKAIANYIRQNNLEIYDHYGEKLSKAEMEKLLDNAVAYVRKVHELILADGVSTSDGRYPDLTAEAAKRIHPEDVYKRYNELVKMLDINNAKNQMEKTGKLPLVMLGHDLAEIFGRVVNKKIKDGIIFAPTDAERLQSITHYMEAEIMKKRLFDYLMGRKILEEKLDTAIPPLEKGRLSKDWLEQLMKSIDISKIRGDLEYYKRGEWAARNFLTSFYPVQSEFTTETEKNKIIMLRLLFSYEFDRGYENLFRNYDIMIKRNQMMYHSLKALLPYYMGDNHKWDAEGYEAWKKRGVTYGDVKKGVWSIDANHVITPLPSGFEFDIHGNVIGAKLRQSPVDGRLAYDYSVVHFTGSDYAERFINASFMFKKADGTWGAGLPGDSKTHNMMNQMKSYYDDLASAKLGKESPLTRKQIFENISTLEKTLGERMKLVPRSTLADDPSRPLPARMLRKTTEFLERAVFGGIQETSWRMREWHATQTYARIVLETFHRDWEAGHFWQDEVKASRDAKKQLGSLRSDLLSLMQNTSLSTEQKTRIQELRNMEIPHQQAEIKRLEADAIRTQKLYGKTDRDMKKMGNMYIPFFYVAENTSMRDPRITYGSAYGLDPAIMSGYQTGQFVGEHPQMWAGFHLLPGHRLLNYLARPSYWYAAAYAQHLRPFFTRMVGYSSVYHIDPEYGHRSPLAHSHHEQSIAEAVQSIFKPTQGFDWLTRIFTRPLVRTKYKDEFGWSFKEEHSMVGSRGIYPLSLKPPESGESYSVDNWKYQLRGFGAGQPASAEIRRRKIGLSFREEFQLWTKRYESYAKLEANAIKSQLSSYISTSTDAAEISMLKSQIKEIDDVFNATRKAWKIPIVRDFFRQGYYAVENRSGYDINTIGGAHRQQEMATPWHKNISKAVYPGIIFSEPGHEGKWQLYPFMSSILDRPLQESDVQQRSAIHDLNARLRPERPDVLLDAKAEGKRDVIDLYLSKTGGGRHLASEALRDVYRREMPLLLQFANVEMERHMYQYANSPYIFPLAPLYVTAYQILKKSSWGRKQTWTAEFPKQKDIGPITDAERAQEMQMQQARSGAGMAKQNTYTCPTHSLILPVGGACPFCRTQQMIDSEKASSFLKRKPKQALQNAKNWAMAAASFGGTVPIGNYNQFYNSVMCPNHGIQHERGTLCPFCLRDSTKSGQYTIEQMGEYDKQIKDINKQIKSLSFKFIADEKLGQQINSLVKEKERISRNYPIHPGHEQLYNASKHLVKHWTAKMGKRNAEQGYSIKYY
ncbi:MAG: hypothetical protein ABIH83_03930 [Candidatus Micrarchaeota archaeon]